MNANIRNRNRRRPQNQLAAVLQGLQQQLHRQGRLHLVALRRALRQARQPRPQRQRQGLGVLEDDAAGGLDHEVKRNQNQFLALQETVNKVLLNRAPAAAPVPLDHQPVVGDDAQHRPARNEEGVPALAHSASTVGLTMVMFEMVDQAYLELPAFQRLFAQKLGLNTVIRPRLSAADIQALSKLMSANFFYFLHRANGKKWFTKNPADFKRMILLLLEPHFNYLVDDRLENPFLQCEELRDWAIIHMTILVLYQLSGLGGIFDHRPREGETQEQVEIRVLNKYMLAFSRVAVLANSLFCGGSYSRILAAAAVHTLTSKYLGWESSDADTSRDLTPYDAKDYLDFLSAHFRPATRKAVLRAREEDDAGGEAPSNTAKSSRRAQTPRQDRTQNNKQNNNSNNNNNAGAPNWRSAALKLLKKKVNYGTGFLSKLTKYLRENKTQERPPANTQLGRHMTQCESSLLGAGPNP